VWTYLTWHLVREHEKTMLRSAGALVEGFSAGVQRRACHAMYDMPVDAKAGNPKCDAIFAKGGGGRDIEIVFSSNSTA
jgi:hypothetical protein